MVTENDFNFDSSALRLKFALQVAALLKCCVFCVLAAFWIVLEVLFNSY